MADEQGTPAPSSLNQVMAYSKDAPALPDADQEESRRLASYWKDQLDQTDEEYRKFVKRGRIIEKRYRDDRNRVDEEGQRRYNLLWSNVQIMLPALYARAPQPVAERRFRDKDPIGRGAAQILERSLRNEVEINGFHEAVECAVLDYLLPGRGVVWVRYEPEIEESVSIPTGGEMEMRDAQGPIEADDDSETEDKLRDTGDRIVRESVPIDYVPWTDFFTFPAKARTWKEVVAVGKRVYMTREQMIRRFGKEAGKAVPLEKDDRERRRQNESVVPDEDADRKGEVFEIWSRTDERVYWLAQGYDFLLDRRDDPLQIDDFFPVPRPLYANATTGTLVPVADYMEYQDQAIQIDELTQRISMLSKACKVAGVYNAQAKDIQRLLDESVENELIPVDSWAVFADKGGVAGQISLLPLKEIIGVINELMAVKEKVMAEADRLTGITDVLRGTTDERETMGGQRLKQNNAGTRLSKRQSDVARFCRDVVRLMAQVMSAHFTPKSLVEASGALYEEGLGDVDPDEIEMQTPQPAPMPPQNAAPAPAGGVAPAVPSPTQGAPAPTNPGAGAPPPPGNNVVPIRPGVPGAPMQGQVIPPGHPGPMPGMPPQPPVPPEVLARIEGMKRIMAAIQLLRDEKLRGFRVDIEVDSTIFGDAAQEKADRTEFLTAVTGFMEKSFQIGQLVPEAAPLMGKFLQFGVRGFRVGRDLESAIEDFVDEMNGISKRMAQQKASQPNPEQMKAQLEQAKIQGQLQNTQLKNQGDQVKAQAEVQSQQVEAQSKSADMAADTQRAQLELQIEKVNLQIELAKLQADARQQQHDASMAAADRQHEAGMAAAQRAHEVANPKPLPVPPQQASLGNR